jgi:hypothetical protein
MSKFGSVYNKLIAEYNISAETKKSGGAAKKRFDSYCNNVAANFISELAPAAALALRALPSAASRIVPGLMGTGVGLGAAKLGADMLGAVTGDTAAVSRLAQQAGQSVTDFMSSLEKDPQKTPITGINTTTASSPLPTSTAAPATTPPATSTTTPAAVATPTSTTTPADTDAIATGTVVTPSDVTAAAVPVAAAKAGVQAGARAITQAKDAAAAKTKSKGGVGGYIGLGQTTNKGIPGVKDPIIGDKFFI